MATQDIPTPEKVKPTKAELFKTVGKRRVKKVTEAIRVLGNCADTTRYEYTDQQREKMFKRLDKAMAELTEKFYPVPVEAPKEFDFDDEPDPEPDPEPVPVFDDMPGEPVPPDGE